ncbi:PREDICTED: uncharacterized protein LOC109208612 [Nicotiana attenuata]|uniref:uncharacterized protein LOC109208612 n=1 Tax=Nicotiana attenuata TaxID=49451 RepID=UPI00090548C6|nr:PREDICTED: uncharacterized protein LOC109208612 [Nicotiana attenuata]
MGNDWEIASDYNQSPNGRIWIGWKPQQVEVKALWQGLRNLNNNITDPWIVLGDFNAVLSVNDRQNGILVHPNEIKDFQECIEDIGLGQLKRTGSLFSWSNKRDAHIRIYSFIDWAFGNSKWFDNYGHLEAVYLNPECSDHSPIIVNTGRIRQNLPRPFRLINILLQNEDFKAVIKTTWQYEVPGYTMYGICKKLKLIELNTRHLQKEVSNLEWKVEDTRGRLQVTQPMLNSDLYNPNLIQKERDLIFELEKWSNIHEEVLRQKSRAVCNIAKDGYCLNKEEQHGLIKPVTKEEILQALNDLPADKAPGGDDFPVEFFKANLDVVGDDVITAILQFFENGKILKEINNTTITLVPKVPNPTHVKEFRPIACCTTLADKISIQLMMKAFEHFSAVSGLKAYMEKSSLYITGVDQQLQNQIYDEMHFAVGEIPFKYLGVPLSSKKITVQQCMPLVERMIARIRCWTTKFLSYSGRVQLIKSVLFEIQTYWSQNFLIPKKNKATISKLLWAITAKKDTLWVQWIHSFYIKGKSISTMETPKQACWLVRKIFDARKWYGNNDLCTELQQLTHTGKFVIKKAYKYLLPQYPRVIWKNLNMIPCSVPKYQFILWLELQKRLSTADKMAKWGIQVPRNCVLCRADAEETHTHLFFDCDYSKQMWSSFLCWTGESSQVGTWEEEIERLTTKQCNSKTHAEVLG